MCRRLFAVLVVGLAANVPAAPVPKAPPRPEPKSPADLLLGNARVQGDIVQITYTALVPVSVAKRNAKPLPGPAVEIEWARETVSTHVTLAGTVGSTAGGKVLTTDELVTAIGDGAAVVRSAHRVDPGWRKLFADDVIFLEPKADSPLPPPGLGGVNPPPGVPLAPLVPAPPLAPPSLPPAR